MKSDQLVLLAGAGVLAYLYFRPKPLTTEQQLWQDLQSTLGLNRSAVMPTQLPFAATMASDGVSADLVSPEAGVTSYAPLQFSQTSSPFKSSDNPLQTHVDYGGATGIGMPATSPSDNNNTTAAPMIAAPLGVPQTAIQAPDQWQNGGAMYIGATPPMQFIPLPLPPPPPIMTGGYPDGAPLPRVDPTYQLAPFEYFANDDATGFRYVRDARNDDGRNVKLVAWPSD